MIRPGDIYQSKKTGLMYSVKTMSGVGPVLYNVEDPDTYIRPPWDAVKSDFIRIGYLSIMDVFKHIKDMFDGKDGYCGKPEALAALCVTDLKFLNTLQRHEARMNQSLVTWEDVKDAIGGYLANMSSRCRLYRIFRYVEHFRVHSYYDMRRYDYNTRLILVNGKVVAEVTLVYDGKYSSTPFRKTFNSEGTWERNYNDKKDDAFTAYFSDGEEAARFVAACSYAALAQLR